MEEYLFIGIGISLILAYMSGWIHCLQCRGSGYAVDVNLAVEILSFAVRSSDLMFEEVAESVQAVVLRFMKAITLRVTC